MRKIALIITLSACVFSSISAATKSDRLASDIKFISNIATNPSATEAYREVNVPVISNGEDRYVDVILTSSDTEATAGQLAAMGVAVGTVTAEGMTARIPVDKIGRLQKIEGLKGIQISRPVTHCLDQAREAGKVTAVHAGTGLALPYKGEGTIVGIIDNGFQYNHAAFRNAETGESRISRIWEQKCDTTEALRPDNFTYGCEYAPGKATLQRQYDLKTISHGSHVAGIAVGSETKYSNPYYGVSPKSEIVLVSTKATESTILDGVKYIFDYAESQHKPCVINLSLGLNLGPHDGTSSADRMLDALQGPGKLIVGAAGNNASSDIHASKTFSIKDHSLQTAIKFTYYGKTQMSWVDIWGTVGKKFKTRLYVYDKTAGKELASFDAIDATVTDTKTLQYKGIPSGATDSATVTIYAVSGINSVNNRPSLTLTTVCSNIDKKQIYIGIDVEASSGVVHMWNDNQYSTFDNLGNPEFVAGDGNYSVCELGGTGKNVISVGAYSSKKQYTTLGGSSYSSGYTVGDMCAFSSKGPTIDGRVKPEITAPGSYIVSAYNRYYSAMNASSMVYSVSVDSYTHYYGAMSGTSMSAPFVSGVMSLWLQADSTLTPELAKKILQETAINDSYTGEVRESGSEQWGYGKINAYDGLKKCVESGVGEIERGNLDYSFAANGGTLQILLSSDASNVEVAVYDSMGRETGRYSAANVDALSPITINDIPQGVAIVKLATSQSSHTFKAVMR